MLSIQGVSKRHQGLLVEHQADEGALQQAEYDNELNKGKLHACSPVQQRALT